MTPRGAGGPALAGRRVLLTRSPDRAGAMARALAGAGAEPLLLPVIDFERMDDSAGLSAALDRLAAGEDAWLAISSITTVRALKEGAAARGVRLASPPRVIGKQRDHLKLRLAVDDAQMDALGWGMADRARDLADSMTVDVAYQLERDDWNGRQQLQLKLADLRR